MAQMNIRRTGVKTCFDAKWAIFSEFFNQFLTTSKKCDFSLARQDNKIFLINKGEVTLPIEVNIIYQDATVKKILIEGKDKKILLPIASLKNIKLIYLEPAELSLDLDKTNNYLPRKVNIKIIPLYYFIYEIPIFLKQDSFNIITGPTLGSNSLGLKTSLQKPLDWISYTSVNYEFAEGLLNSTAGFQLNHLGLKQATAGFELYNKKDYSNDSDAKEDIQGIKLFLRKELWPASYGLFEPNDHITFYILRDTKLKGTTLLGGLEDIHNLNYRQKDEAIVGLNLTLNRARTYPDYFTGWKAFLNLENAGHFLGGDTAFFRTNFGFDKYFCITDNHKIALNSKFGFGSPGDKYLFYLGGIEGLRGYGRKEIKGSQMLLCRMEYRAKLKDDMGIYLLDNTLHFKDFSIVPFFDVGKTWFTNFNSTDFKKDAGLGFTLKVALAGLLEETIVRFDVSRAIDEPKEKPRLWFSIANSF